MLSSLKKKADTASSQMPAWHPNFRNYQKLPDIKVVRTAFFINGFTALIAIGLIVWTVMREYELHTTREAIAAFQAQIDQQKPESDRDVGLFKKFQDEEKKAGEVDNFVKSKPPLSALLQRFADTRPRNVELKSIDVRDIGIVLRVSVRGDPVTAYADHANYVEVLKKEPFLTSLYEPADIRAANTDPTTGYVEGEIQFGLKPPPKVK